MRLSRRRMGMLGQYAGMHDDVRKDDANKSENCARLIKLAMEVGS